MPQELPEPIQAPVNPKHEQFLSSNKKNYLTPTKSFLNKMVSNNGT